MALSGLSIAYQADRQAVLSTLHRGIAGEEAHRLCSRVDPGLDTQAKKERKK